MDKYKASEKGTKSMKYNKNIYRQVHKDRNTRAKAKVI